jgi:hypothetical protein
MTAEEHNKFVGIAHLVYAGIHTLLALVMCGFFFFMVQAMRNLPTHGEPAPPFEIFYFFIPFILFFSSIFTIPAFISGYGLLKRKSWAKTASIVAGIMAAMNFPLGTMVCVYTCWFAFGEAGKSLYDPAPANWWAEHNALHGTPPPPPPNWGMNNSREREKQYAPPTQPPQPPDWRQ